MEKAQDRYDQMAQAKSLARMRHSGWNRTARYCRKGIRIGFPRLKKLEGPKIFLSRLKRSIEQQNLAKTTHFLFPIHNVGLFSSVARSWYRKPYVLRLDGIYFDKAGTIGSNKKLNEPIFRSMEGSIGVIYQSEFDKKLIEYFSKRRKKPFTIIPNGVDLEEFSRYGDNHRRGLGVRENDRVLITSAVWRAHKRLRNVLQVFMKLEADDVPYHLIILGNPDRKIPDHPRIHCTGHVKPSDLPTWYRTGDVFIYLSWIDHCPNTVIEALACGLPVVSTNQGGTPEIVNRVTGGIVVKADEDYSFGVVDLDNPPSPDHDKIANAILQIFSDYDFFCNSINLAEIDIRNIAVRYVDFITQCLLTRDGFS